jgi:uncharacterized protein (DUF3084 family)
VDEQAGRITTLEAQVTDLEDQVAQAVTDRNQALAAKAAAEAERDAALAAAEFAQQDRDAALAERDTARAERDTALAERDAAREALARVKALWADLTAALSG